MPQTPQHHIDSSANHSRTILVEKDSDQASGAVEIEKSVPASNENSQQRKQEHKVTIFGKRISNTPKLDKGQFESIRLKFDVSKIPDSKPGIEKKRASYRENRGNDSSDYIDSLQKKNEKKATGESNQEFNVQYEVSSSFSSSQEDKSSEKVQVPGRHLDLQMANQAAKRRQSKGLEQPKSEAQQINQRLGQFIQINSQNIRNRDESQLGRRRKHSQLQKINTSNVLSVNMKSELSVRERVPSPSFRERGESSLAKKKTVAQPSFALQSHQTQNQLDLRQMQTVQGSKPKNAMEKKSTHDVTIPKHMQLHYVEELNSTQVNLATEDGLIDSPKGSVEPKHTLNDIEFEDEAEKKEKKLVMIAKKRRSTMQSDMNRKFQLDSNMKAIDEEFISNQKQQNAQKALVSRRVSDTYQRGLSHLQPSKASIFTSRHLTVEKKSENYSFDFSSTSSKKQSSAQRNEEEDEYHFGNTLQTNKPRAYSDKKINDIISKSFKSIRSMKSSVKSHSAANLGDEDDDEEEKKKEAMRRASVFSNQTDIMRPSKKLQESEVMGVMAKGKLFSSIKKIFKQVKQIHTTSKEPEDVSFFTSQTIQRQMDQRELVERLKLKKLKILKQNHPFRVKWDLFVIVLSIWSSYSLPVEIAFEPEFFENSTIQMTNYIIDGIFFADIILNFRTSYQNILTGDEITDPKRIAINYILGRFWIDLLASIPFEIVLQMFFDQNFAQKFILLSMLKLFRVLRLGRMITYMNSTDDLKLSLRLFKLFFFLILYIHCTACLWFFFGNRDKTWKPSQLSYYGVDNFYELDGRTQYLITFYNSILALTGNDIYPKNNILFSVGSIMLISGAIINANIFGTIAVIAQTINRKAQRFQEQIDVANESMKNMKLPESLQASIRDFMMFTQSNLDNQKELDQFLSIISPSLRLQVTQHIFMNAIESNPVFQGNQDIIDFLINDIMTLLYLPEDIIITQGQNGTSFFFIAQGDCEVWIKDHLKENKYVKQLVQGEYFGEVALLTNTQRTATVKSSNYCTMASLDKTAFFDMCNSFSDIFIKLKQCAVYYQDPWKLFKLKLLKQIDYFQAESHQEEFLDEIHYYMKEEFYESGTEIISAKEPCQSILFLVQGRIELQILSPTGEIYILETLKQGDIIGQYSVLFEEQFLFSAVAQSNVRLLTIDQSFFLDHNDQIQGLAESVEKAEKYVEHYGVPICDFKIYSKQFLSPIEKMQRGVKHVITLNKMNPKSKNKFLELLSTLQQKIKREQKQMQKQALAIALKHSDHGHVHGHLNRRNSIECTHRFKHAGLIDSQTKDSMKIKDKRRVSNALLFGHQKLIGLSKSETGSRKGDQTQKSKNRFINTDRYHTSNTSSKDGSSSSSRSSMSLSGSSKNKKPSKEIKIDGLGSDDDQKPNELVLKFIHKIKNYKEKIKNQNMQINLLTAKKQTMNKSKSLSKGRRMSLQVKGPERKNTISIIKKRKTKSIHETPIKESIMEEDSSSSEVQTNLRSEHSSSSVLQTDEISNQSSLKKKSLMEKEQQMSSPSKTNKSKKRVNQKEPENFSQQMSTVQHIMKEKGGGLGGLNTISGSAVFGTTEHDAIQEMSNEESDYSKGTDSFKLNLRQTETRQKIKKLSKGQEDMDSLQIEARSQHEAPKPKSSLLITGDKIPRWNILHKKITNHLKVPIHERPAGDDDGGESPSCRLQNNSRQFYKRMMTKKFRK